MKILVPIFSFYVLISGSERISQQKCRQYSETVLRKTVLYGTLSLEPKIHSIQIDQCDPGQGLIVGGENAKAGEFPHMVAIGYKNLNNDVDFKCGGSLISERFVLTVAHCRRAGRSNAFIVRLGDLNLKLKERELPEEDILIKEYIIHELYNPIEGYHDIAVIKLTRSVIFSKYIRPACLMEPATGIRYQKAIATGWGLVEAFADNTADILQKVVLPIVDNQKCQSLIDHNVENIQMCAGEGGKDTCQGDAGGPLQIVSEENRCMYVIVGISSFGSTFCGTEDSPTVYIKVSAYLDWIEDKVWGS